MIDGKDVLPVALRRPGLERGLRPLARRQLGIADALHAMMLAAGHGDGRDGRGGAARRFHIAAARGEDAARRPVEGRGHLARNRRQRGGGLAASEDGNAVEQAPGIGVARVAENFADGPLLHQLARIHDPDAVADAHHGAEIVADEDDGGIVLLAQATHQIQHRRLHRHVETRGGLVHEEQRGLGHQRHGDDDPLLLPTRKLMGVAVEDAFRIRQIDLAQHEQSARPRLGLARLLVDDGDFHQLPADGHDRIQARHGILIDHRHAPAAELAQLLLRHAAHIATLEEDPPSGEPPHAAEIGHDGKGDRRLAAAGFPDQAQRLALLELEGDARHDIHLTRPGEIGDAGVLELEDRRRGGLVRGDWGHQINPSC